MKKLMIPLENFAFKAFDFSGRATLLDYWTVMPLVWALIAFLFYGDVMEGWGMLLARQIPPLNPLYWGSILVFVLTFIPRLSLTVRRLHDSSKSGKWVKLPFLALSSSVVLFLGLMSAMITSGFANGGSGVAEGLGAMAFVMAFAFGSLDNISDTVFASVAVMNAMGWESIIALLSELTTPAQQINVSTGIANIGNDLKEAPAETGVTLLVLLALTAAPFVCVFLHMFFMISPAKPDHDLNGSAPMSGASLRKQGVSSDNPFAGYKHLYEKTPEQKAAAQATAKEEIKSLYQNRVLGSQGSG